jgi:hypothetical protein
MGTTSRVKDSEAKEPIDKEDSHMEREVADEKNRSGVLQLREAKGKSEMTKNMPDEVMERGVS